MQLWSGRPNPPPRGHCGYFVDPTYWQPWDKEGWNLAPPEWQAFYARWYGATQSQSDSPSNPNSPSLSVEHLKGCSHVDGISEIFIRRSYLMMFDIIWARSLQTQGREGLIITGQSGIGKTFFNIYLLVQLLLLGQVVLFSPDGYWLFLFNHEGVYASTIPQLIRNGTPTPLPEPVSSSSDVFIWSLFEIRDKKEPDSLFWSYPCFPVQISSPDPIRYQIWKERRDAILTALPLWTHDELTQGLRYQAEYQSLLDALEKVHNSNNWDELDAYPDVRALLKDLYGGENVSLPSPQNALAYLLDAAIERFGYSAGDVFSAVTRFEYVTESHLCALYVESGTLEDALKLLSRNHIDAYDMLSDRVVAISPMWTHPLVSVTWKVDFKSDWTARNLVKLPSFSE